MTLWLQRKKELETANDDFSNIFASVKVNGAKKTFTEYTKKDWGVLFGDEDFGGASLCIEQFGCEGDETSYLAVVLPTRLEVPVFIWRIYRMDDVKGVEKFELISENRGWFRQFCYQWGTLCMNGELIKQILK